MNGTNHVGCAFNLRRAGIFAALLLAMGLAGILIWKSSFIARDGARYFAVNDDELISLRYARNLAHGNGLVWNAGERVEGFTNLLWTLYATVWATLTPRRLLPLVIQVSGVLCLLAQCLLLRRTAQLLWQRERVASRLGEAMAFLLPIMFYPLVYWSIGGLEVCAIGALFSWALLLHIQGRFSACCLVLGAAYWTRPDSLLPGALILAATWYDVHAGRLRYREWVRGACVLAACIAILFLFRFYYYGEFLPNTYVLKLGQFHLLDRLRLNAWGYLLPFLYENLPIMLIAMASLALNPTFYKFILAAPAILMIAYACGIGGDSQPYWRFIAPFMPALGLVAILDIPSPAQRRFRPLLMGGVAVGLTFWTVASFGCYRTLLKGPDSIEQCNIETAIVLNAILKHGATIGVFHAGAIPYYTDFQGIDFLGKCDSTIAHLAPHLDGGPQMYGMHSPPGHNKYDLPYSIGALNPTFVQGFAWRDENFGVYVKENYVGIPTSFRTCFTGPYLLLLRDSPYVDWAVATNIDATFNKR